jgi:hypothetical protein
MNYPNKQNYPQIIGKLSKKDNGKRRPPPQSFEPDTPIFGSEKETKVLNMQVCAIPFTFSSGHHRGVPHHSGPKRFPKTKCPT